MALQIIEGTWEEIKTHEQELAGQQFRLIPLAETGTSHVGNAPAKNADRAKELHGYGMFAGLLSTEEYFREKREDTAREDRPLL